MDQTKITARSDITRTTAFTAADQAVDLARTLNPDLQLELRFDARRDNVWYDCSDDPRADTDPPKVIQWLAYRTLYLDPHRETATLLEPISRKMIADGWTPRSTSTGGESASIDLTKDGFTLSMGGDPGSSTDHVSTVRIGVYSPCITAPAGILEWTPTASPTPTSTPASTPTP